MSNHTWPLHAAGASSKYSVCIPRANITRERGSERERERERKRERETETADGSYTAFKT